ncbi:MAG: hypothetical protein ACRDFT_04605 [bacterium]
MGLLDFLTSTKRPAPGTPVLSKGQVLERITALNRPTAPFQITETAEEGADLVAEWKIVDAQWYTIFAEASLSKVFRIYLKLDEAKHEVRASDREYAVEWKAGVPKLKLAVSAFRGQKQSIEFSKAYAFTENLAPGKVYQYRFDTGEIKGPIQDAVTGAGWTYKGVAFGKL